MGRGRLEAFSDGVIAIIITIMVLELKVPHGADIASLLHQWPVFSSYVLSFLFVGIYWVNHHHLLHTVRRVTGGVLWTNLHLLLWLSLVPFTTGWMGENHYAPVPTAVYGANLLLSGVAYTLLGRAIMRSDGCDNSLLAKAIGSDIKGKLSLLLYLIAVPAALYVSPWIACAIYGGISILWLVPDQRIERMLSE